MAINESQLALLKVQMKRATSSEWNRTRRSEERRVGKECRL